MAGDQRFRSVLAITAPLTACLLLMSCVHRAALVTSAVSPSAVTQPALGEREARRRPGPPPENRKAYWARIAAYKRASQQTRALRARLGMTDPVSPRTVSTSGPNPFTWTFLGPQPILTSNPSNPVSGSIRDVVLDPHNTSVLYVLTYLGKVWKTSDAGQTWVPLMDYGPVTIADKLVADPVQPDTLYVENGDLFVSSDGGQTWNSLPPVAQDAAQDCRTIGFAVSPSGGAWLALEDCPSGSSGLYRSTNGGAAWNLVLQPENIFDGDLRFNPGNGNYAYFAATNNVGSVGSVYISTNQGVTWSDVSPSASFVSQSYPYLGSLQVAPAASSPSTLYLLAGLSSETLETNALYKSTNAGASWQQATNLPPDLGLPRPPGLIAVDPLDPTLVFFGSVNLFRSQDGGNTWQNAMTAASGLSLHVDQHALVFSPDGTRFYESNDGGIWTATQPYGTQDWTSLNTSLGTAEIYSIAIDPQNTNRAFAGTQDNTTLQFSGSLGWAQAGVCGDGLATGIDSSNSATVYAVCDYGIFRSSTGGAPGTWTQLDPSVLSFRQPQFTLDNSTPNTLYVWPTEVAGPTALYQSLDAGDTWRRVFICPTGECFQEVAVSQSNPDIVYLMGGNQLWSTLNAHSNANPTWQNITVPGIPNGGEVIFSLAVDPANAQALALFVQQENWILKSADGGATWLTTPVGGSLSTATRTFSSDLLIDPDLPNTWYLAMGLAVFRSSDAGQTWYPLATGLPLVEPGGVLLGASGLQLHRASRTLWAPTAGRGVWELAVPVTAPRVQAASLQPSAPATAATLTVSGVNFDANSVVQINSQSVPTTFVSATELEASAPASAFPAAGFYYVSVYKPGASGGTSDPLQLAVGMFVYDGGVVNSANPSTTELVPGTIMSIYGSSLAPGPMSARAAPLPRGLNGVEVLVNDTPAPLIYVSPSQINLIVPWEVAGQTQATIVVQNNGLQSPPVQVQVGADAPAIFTLNQQGTGQGAVLIANTATIVAPVGAFPGSRPANPGEYIEIYATGFGPVSQDPPDGQSSSGLDPVTQGSVEVLFGCLPCIAGTPTYAGLAPGFPGLYQINVQVPVDAPTGDAVPLQVWYFGPPGTPDSNIVTVAIQ
jgi:uncharacterized protein (TIGR03437 family)